MIRFPFLQVPMRSLCKMLGYGSNCFLVSFMLPNTYVKLRGVRRDVESLGATHSISRLHIGPFQIPINIGTYFAVSSFIAR